MAETDRLAAAVERLAGAVEAEMNERASAARAAGQYNAGFEAARRLYDDPGASSSGLKNVLVLVAVILIAVVVQRLGDRDPYEDE